MDRLYGRHDSKGDSLNHKIYNRGKKVGCFIHAKIVILSMSSMGDGLSWPSEVDSVNRNIGALSMVMMHWIGTKSVIDLD